MSRQARDFVNMVRVLEKFQGWDYYTYKRQPAHFLVNLFNFLDIEQEHSGQPDN